LLATQSSSSQKINDFSTSSGEITIPRHSVDDIQKSQEKLNIIQVDDKYSDTNIIEND